MVLIGKIYMFFYSEGLCMNTSKFMLALSMLLSLNIVIAETDRITPDQNPTIDLVAKIQKQAANNFKHQKQASEQLLRIIQRFPNQINDKLKLANIFKQFDTNTMDNDEPIDTVAQSMFETTKNNIAYKNLQETIANAVSFGLTDYLPIDLAQAKLNLHDLNPEDEQRLITLFFQKLFPDTSAKNLRRVVAKKTIALLKATNNNLWDIADSICDSHFDCTDTYGIDFCTNATQKATMLFTQELNATAEQILLSHISELTKKLNETNLVNRNNQETSDENIVITIAAVLNDQNDQETNDYDIQVEVAH